MDKKTVLIISEHPADFYSLTAALERARPARFHPLTVNTRDQPVEAMIDPAIDVVILAYTLETEYLLRLAQKNKLAVPIIVLIDHEAESKVGKLKEAGATDYIVRGLISDDMLHRILDYSIVLHRVTLQHEHVVQQQRVERAAQEAGEHLRSVTGVVAADAGSFGATGRGVSFSRSAAPSERTAGSGAEVANSSMETPQAAGMIARTAASPWKTMLFFMLVAVLLAGAALLRQQMENESRLSRLEASSEMLTQQVLQIHAGLARPAPKPPPAAPPEAAAAANAPSSSTAAPGSATAQVSDQFGRPGSNNPASSVAAAAAIAVDDGTEDSPPITRVAPGPAATWFINLGTFNTQSAARRFARSLGPTSHPLELQPVMVGMKDLYRVRLVNLPNAETAETLAANYQASLGGSRLWVGRE